MSKNNKRGVVVLLKGDRPVLLAADLTRHEAAVLIRHTKKQHRPLKFFHVAAEPAVKFINKLNHGGIPAHA